MIGLKSSRIIKRALHGQAPAPACTTSFAISLNCNFKYQPPTPAVPSNWSCQSSKAKLSKCIEAERFARIFILPRFGPKIHPN